MFPNLLNPVKVLTQIKTRTKISKQIRKLRIISQIIQREKFKAINRKLIKFQLLTLKVSKVKKICISAVKMSKCSPILEQWHFLLRRFLRVVSTISLSICGVLVLFYTQCFVATNRLQQNIYKN